MTYTSNRTLTRHINKEKQVQLDASYRSIFKNAKEGLFRVESNGRWFCANPAFLEMFGFSPFPELRDPNIDLFQLLFPQRSSRVEALRMLKERGELISVESEAEKLDGMRFPISLNLHVVNCPTSDQEIIYEGSVRVLSDQEQSSAIGSLLYHSLESASDGLMIVDLSSEKADVIHVSNAWSKITGYSSHEFKTLKDLEKLLGENPLAEQLEMLQNPLANHALHQQTMELYTKQEFSFWGKFSLLILQNESGNNSHLVILLSDVSEMKALEEQITHMQKMEAIGKLAGGIAHDFNNNLSVILGYTNLLLSRKLGYEIQDFLEQINMAAEKSALLTGQLLTFSRKTVANLVPLHVDEVISKTQPLLKRIIGEDITLRFFQAAPEEKVMMNPSQFDQLIFNLAVNARDAMPNGGSLLIETNIKTIAENDHQHHAIEPGRYLNLTVSDTGKGMDSETIKHIFEPFFTTKETASNTGLGLATVHGMVEQMGGRITVYSEPNLGATFQILLPTSIQATTSSSQIPQSDSTANHPRPARLLIVEDDLQIRKMLGLIFDQTSMEVVIKASGNEALQMFEEQQETFDLLITDMIMPGLNGVELATHLKKYHPEIKVLYMSGYSEQVITHNPLLDDPQSFIQKPFSPETLLSRVRELLSISP